LQSQINTDLESSNNDKERLKLLFESESWSEEDRRWLMEYLDTQDGEELRRLMSAHFQADAAAAPGNSTHAGRLLALIHEKIQPARKRPRLFSLNASGWRKLAVAALVLLIAGKTVLFFLPASPDKIPPAGRGRPASYAHDLPPGRNNAILTLADGHSITLDSAANGRLAQQGNTKVIKLNGQIAYRNTGGAQGDDAILFNTISTARGNQYQLTLSDGSKVWLNAASSLRFPTSFKGKERRVEVTGEAYFEIAKNPAMPFIVQAGSGEIDVLGTHFNVNAYADEPSIKTTLLEGAVAVKKATARQMLVPGQQAEFSPTGGIALPENVDVIRETAWKDGFFWFNNTDIHTLMRQVSRWYDVEVEFKGNISDDGFTGKVSRSVPLSKLLNVLEQYELQFKIEGKKIIVLP
jgi:ferric-dicitrate binding protein FerR (iron transport regulator)